MSTRLTQILTRRETSIGGLRSRRRAFGITIRPARGSAKKNGFRNVGTNLDGAFLRISIQPHVSFNEQERVPPAGGSLPKAFRNAGENHQPLRSLPGKVGNWEHQRPHPAAPALEKRLSSPPPRCDGRGSLPIVSVFGRGDHQQFSPVRPNPRVLHHCIKPRSSRLLDLIFLFQSGEKAADRGEFMFLVSPEVGILGERRESLYLGHDGFGH